MKPFIGSFFTLKKYSDNTNVNPLVDLCEELYYKEKKIVPAFVGIAGQ